MTMKTGKKSFIGRKFFNYKLTRIIFNYKLTRISCNKVQVTLHNKVSFVNMLT